MVKFWEEEAGQQSSTRLIFLIGSVWLMGITTYLLTLINSGKVSLTEIGLFFGGTFATLATSKLVQKYQERDVANTNTTTK